MPEMRLIQTDVLVIGGGATGTGILRDLAMRGFKCILVERRDLAYGTTGRYHGLLHSGARYVVNDPQAAKECYEENQILRRIMPQCIEDTGGYFVLTPEDDPAYVPKFIAGCRTAGITLESIPVSKMLKQEPLLNPNIKQCFWVPDASADSFLAADLNVASAQQYGGQVMTYHEVMHLVVIQDNQNGKPQVTGAVCHDLVKDEDLRIEASLVVNASGAWAGKIAGTAGIHLAMVPGKGTMLALNHRIVNTVINRCKLPSDGDILVPAHTVAIIGTTDIKVTDPDHYAIEPWEIQMMLDEGEKIIPRFKHLRILRAWASVRPLVQGTGDENDRDISRAFVLLDHADRDGIDGIITITSGKWTTYRKMAQVTVDKVCEKLKVIRPCHTHLEPLPRQSADQNSHHYLGARLEKIEREESYGQLICECELTAECEIEQSIIQAGANTLDDIRRDTRLGMGPCQGAFCSFRAAGMLHSLRHLRAEEINVSLRDFLQERWKGNLPILWGQQLRQARFNELIYVDLLNATNLPGDPESKLAATEYSPPEGDEKNDSTAETYQETKSGFISQSHPADVIVIGGGFAGLFFAWRAAQKDRRANIITKGWGSPYWSSGCIDIFGYQPPDYARSVESPRVFLDDFIKVHPEHPYSLAGSNILESAIHSLLSFSQEVGYPYHGSLDANVLLPTALGTLRPTCLAPETMIAGDASRRIPMAIVGFSRFFDFYPGLVADNLNAQGITASDIILDLKSLENRKFVTGIVLARLFDEPDFREEVIEALKPRLSSVGRVGFPAVLGLAQAIRVKEHLESALGLPVFEIPGLPPSIPGMRLQNLLVTNIEKLGGMVFNGMEVIGAGKNGNSIASIDSIAPPRIIRHNAQKYILATGGFLGGGIKTGNNGYAQETIFGFGISNTLPRSLWLQNRFLGDSGHPIFRTGVKVNHAFQPIGDAAEVIYDNLFATGSALGNCDPIRERSLEGIALATSFSLSERLFGDATP